MDILTGWAETEQGLVREYAFADFDEAMQFIEHVAQVARAQNHHPEIWNSYNTVRLTLFTHDVSAVTEKDHALAQAIDAI